MEPLIANLAKMQRLLDNGYKLSSISWKLLSESSFRTTVLLKGRRDELLLQSDDYDFFKFCAKQKISCDDDGGEAFRGVADTTRHNRDAFSLAYEPEAMLKAAFQRLATGHVRFDFRPEVLIADFLESRKWGDARFLPLKAHYFDIFAFVTVTGKRADDSAKRLQQHYPESTRYANRIEELLRKAFDPLNDPIKNYLRFVDVNRADFAALTKQLIHQVEVNNDTFKRLATADGVAGHIGLDHIINMYRRYLDWAVPLLKLVSDAACIVDGKELPDVGLGVTKRVELIRQSSYSDIVDCVDPRVRNAASHSGISFDKEQGFVKFCGLDSDGNRKFDDFELSYAEASRMTGAFIRGFVFGIFAAFGIYQVYQLLMTIDSGEYKRLLLLIDNEALPHNR
jgi:hypothetical protein